MPAHRLQKISHQGWIGTGLGTQLMAFGQFHLDGATRGTLVTGRQPHRRRQCERNEGSRNRQGRHPLLIPGLASPAKEERWRQPMATRHRRDRRGGGLRVIEDRSLSSRVHERRVPATTIWGEIVGPDNGQVQAFATALYPSPGSYTARRLPTSAYIHPTSTGSAKQPERPCSILKSDYIEKRLTDIVDIGFLHPQMQGQRNNFVRERTSIRTNAISARINRKLSIVSR